MFSTPAILMLLCTLTLALHPRNIARDVVAAAATTTVTKTVTSTMTLTTCPAASTSSPRISTAPISSSTTPAVGRTTTTSSSAVPTDSNGAIQRGNSWELPGVGTFRNKQVYTFTGNSLPAGLEASDYDVIDRPWDNAESSVPYNHTFNSTNAKLADGFLNLIVPGGQTPAPPTRRKPMGTPISCAEIVTAECNIKYASVRTYAIFSKVPGTCHGMFYYKDDDAEIDIEFLTDSASAANNGDGSPIPIWYSNQPLVAGNEATQDSIVPPGDPTEAIHEYRFDWTPYSTSFYFDGVRQTVLTSNVPSKPGHIIWNNWANGDPNWSVGPPAQTNILKIQRIEMYYNTTDTGISCEE